MRISELTPRHQFLKMWDGVEERWWLDYNAMLVHMTAVGLGQNIHDVRAQDILRTKLNPGTADPFSDTVQEHTDNVTLHNAYATTSRLLFDGALIRGQMGKVYLPTPTFTRNELLYIDGILRAEGASHDYTVGHQLGVQTTITINDWDEVLSDESVIQVVYDEKY